MQATIRADHLSLVLCAVKLRAYTHGKSPRLCAMSERPVVQLTCHDQYRSQNSRAEAKKYGIRQSYASPIERGDIGRVYERVAREHGRREVVKTWGVGIRALMAEPLYVLDGGFAATSTNEART